VSLASTMTAHRSPLRTDGPTDERGLPAEQHGPTHEPADESVAGDRPTAAAADDLLALLGDEYACDILRALADGPLPARDLIERHGMSRTTVYRRLDRLTDAGIVDSRLRPASDGHHRREFHLAVDEIEFQVGANGVDGAVRADDAASD
jgi:DNA-binding transcriptional ArsR family regulator